MKRLTYDFEISGNHCWQVEGADNLECREVCERQEDNGCKTCPIARAFDRLAAIEDILGDEYNLDRLRELVEAEKEDRYIIMKEPRRAGVHRLTELAEADRGGRCVLLPCKDWLEIVFGDQEVFYGIDTDYLECPIREISVDSSSRCTWYDGWKTVVLKGYDENGFDWEFSPEDIGKTVFFTREAAEAALKARREQDDERPS